MIFTGIADEAGASIEEQVKAHKELGWQYIEIRNVDGQTFTVVPENVFDHVCRVLEKSGIKVSCFASAIANWSRKITGDFNVDLHELKSAIPRMKKLNTRFIRVMSYPNDNLPEKDWRNEVIRRFRELMKIAEDGGIVLAHENCSGWGGSLKGTRDLIDNFGNSPAFGLIYDPGNTVMDGHEPWSFYQSIKNRISYVHVKDDKKSSDGKLIYTYPGEGDCKVRETLLDLKKSGYNGFISIEPHLIHVIHEDKSGGKDTAYKAYVEHGRRTMQILK